MRFSPQGNARAGTPPPRPSWRLLASCLVPLLGVCVWSDAQAFCRTRTCEFRQDEDCPIDNLTGCSGAGEFVYWASPCVSYALQRDGSVAQNISAEQLGELVEAGFRSWSDAACAGGGSPELAVASQGQIACDAVEYDCNVREANSNLIMFRDDFDDASLGLRFRVIALTTITANLVTGELFDADIEINSRDEDFSLDPMQGDPQDVRDLAGVINHELGHLLGLSHSRVSGALMRAAYEGTSVPAADDRAGMCAAAGTATSDPECTATALPPDAGCVGRDVACTGTRRPPEEAAGCACREAATAPAGSAASGRWMGLGLLGLFAYRWRSRRRELVL
jgi:hypothetical protein